MVLPHLSRTALDHVCDKNADYEIQCDYVRQYATYPGKKVLNDFAAF